MVPVQRGCVGMQTLIEAELIKKSCTSHEVMLLSGTPWLHQQPFVAQKIVTVEDAGT